MASLAEQLPGLDELHQQTLGNPNICIAILDGPVDLSHAAFRDAEINQLGDVEASGPAAEHGTLIASILFGNWESGIQGLVPKCKGLSIPIFRNAAAGGVQSASQVDLVHAINWALDLGADIINISGGQIATSPQAHPLLEEMAERCRQRGTLIVAAAGNDGCDCIHLPAAMENVLAVGASDQLGTRWFRVTGELPIATMESWRQGKASWVRKLLEKVIRHPEQA